MPPQAISHQINAVCANSLTTEASSYSITQNVIFVISLFGCPLPQMPVAIAAISPLLHALTGASNNA